MRIVGLGDSVGFGVGDVGPQFIGPGWAGRMGARVGAERVLHLAMPGARTADLPSSQLPAALAFKPDLAVLSIGGNDVLRADFDPAVIRTKLSETLTALNESGCDCVVMGLPDPLRTAPLPYLIKRALSRRTIELNAVLLEVSRTTNTHFISNWHDENVYQRANWHVDRMHPSPSGYENLALKTCQQLGLNISPNGLGTSHTDQAPNRIVWLLVFGSLWFLRRSRDLIPRLLLLTFLEIRDVLLRRPLTGPELSASYVEYSTHH